MIISKKSQVELKKCRICSPLLLIQADLGLPPILFSFQFFEVDQILRPAGGALIFDEASLAQERNGERPKRKHGAVIPCFVKLQSRQFRQQIDAAWWEADLKRHPGIRNIPIAYAATGAPNSLRARITLSALSGVA